MEKGERRIILSYVEFLLGGFEFFDAFLYCRKLVLQLFHVVFHSFDLFSFGHEVPSEVTVVAFVAAAFATPTVSMMLSATAFIMHHTHLDSHYQKEGI